MNGNNQCSKCTSHLKMQSMQGRAIERRPTNEDIHLSIHPSLTSGAVGRAESCSDCRT